MNWRCSKMARKKVHKLLSISSKVYSFALKFYDEQLPFGIQETINVNVKSLAFR